MEVRFHYYSTLLKISLGFAVKKKNETMLSVTVKRNESVGVLFRGYLLNP